MFTSIKLKNFKSLKDISIDLTDKHGDPKKAIFIYGENGSGKTNLISSLEFLSRTFNTLYVAPQRIELRNLCKELENSDQNHNTDFFIKNFVNKVNYSICPLSELIEQHITLNALDPMEIEIGFKEQYENKIISGEYFCKFFNNEIIFEELKCKLENNLTTVFKISNEPKCKLNSAIFKSNQYKANLENLIKKYWGKNTFFAILMNEALTSNKKYFIEMTDETLNYLIRILSNIDIYSKYSDYSNKLYIKNFLKNIKEGKIKSKDTSLIEKTQNVLNMFFTSSYSDIKKVYYKVEKLENDLIGYNLYFEKLIGNEKIDIPANQESTGTLTLLTTLPYMLNAVLGKTVVIDEIDSGVHDLLMSEIIEYLLPMVKGQLIATTHNTLLMEKVDFQNLYVFKIDAVGNKQLVCLGDSPNGKRIQKTHNVRQQYLKGNYDGIPNVGYIDFAEMANCISSKE